MARGEVPDITITEHGDEFDDLSIDLERIIRLVLNSPVEDGEVFTVDGKRSISEFRKKNTDVKTRIVLQTAVEAMKSSPKHIELLFKYGGFEPKKDDALMINLPLIIDDMPKLISASETKKE